MNSDDELRPIRHAQRFAAHLANRDGPPGQAARGSRAEGDDGRWLDQAALHLEPDLAAFDLIGVWAFVQAPLAAHFIFEMLDGIGDERLLPRDAGILQRLIEN